MIMTEKEYFLGIDTSNYKTSIAVVDGFGKIIADERKLLTVKRGKGHQAIRSPFSAYK